MVRGGLGSGVGGLRWLIGVLKDDFLEINDDMMPSAKEGEPKSVRGA